MINFCPVNPVESNTSTLRSIKAKKLFRRFLGHIILAFIMESTKQKESYRVVAARHMHIIRFKREVEALNCFSNWKHKTCTRVKTCFDFG